MMPPLRLLALASVLRFASASFSCNNRHPYNSSTTQILNIDRATCNADADRLDSAVSPAAQGESTIFGFFCVSISVPNETDYNNNLVLSHQPRLPEQAASEPLS